MREILSLLRRYKFLAIAFAAFIALFAWLTFATRPDAGVLQRYSISAGQLQAITLAIAVPYIVIWIIGLVGYLWLRSYAEALGDSKDGQAFTTVSRGMLLVALWLPVSALVSSFASYYSATHPSAIAASVRVVNYVNILLMLPAFYLVYKGSRRLLVVAKTSAHGLTQRQSLLFMIFAVLYVFVALSDSVRQNANGTSVHATYYLPDWATVLTVLIPRLVTWFIGLAAVSNIFLYRQKVKGAIYKEALRSMAIGLGVVIGGITALRVLQSFTTVLSAWGLGAVVLLDYVLLAVLGFGYFMLAKGAKRLLKIEEL